MLIYVATYIVLTFAALTALCRMILHIATLIGTCPETGGRARATGMTIATGFAAIGAGGLVIFASVMPIYANALPAVFLLALGFASLCLGLGFTHAIATLRAVVDPAAVPAAQPAWDHAAQTADA